MQAPGLQVQRRRRPWSCSEPIRGPSLPARLRLTQQLRRLSPERISEPGEQERVPRAMLRKEGRCHRPEGRLPGFNAMSVSSDPPAKRLFGADVDEEQRTNQRQNPIAPKTGAQRVRTELSSSVGGTSCDREQRKEHEQRRSRTEQEPRGMVGVLGKCDQKRGTHSADSPYRVQDVQRGGAG